eukprot:CAMPEP_0184504554 /NCGR_PEP_ID=MMETSP0113_2-20130426/52527_1 /TAXON_ID=91329 /ORGANISM="Norrisiella sphaerica, Strain BC52" /LENGTH=694 /DNA_ID=CAMNT_0026894205 /DNA_START=615 /DNA_END=2696 /DNA_ORIENTATION=-
MTPRASAEIPLPPNYALESTWAAFPTSKIRAPPRAPSPLYTNTNGAGGGEERIGEIPQTRCDVFFIPWASDAVERAKGRRGLLPWDHPEVAKEIPDIISTQASAFASDCRVYAPRFRQPTSESLLDAESNQEAFDLAYADLVRAFRFYMEYENNGAPYMIASNHQGSAFALKLLQEFIDGTALLSRFVVAYLVESSIPMEVFLCSFVDDPDVGNRKCNLRQIRLSEHRKDTGCIVGWQVAGTRSLPVIHWMSNKWRQVSDDTELICVNPLTWEDDQRLVRAEKVRNMALVTGVDGRMRQETLKFCAQIMGSVVAITDTEPTAEEVMGPGNLGEIVSPADFWTFQPAEPDYMSSEEGLIEEKKPDTNEWREVGMYQLSQMTSKSSAGYDMFYGSLRRNINERLDAWTLKTAPWFRSPTRQAISSIFNAPVAATIVDRYANAARTTRRATGPEHIIKFGPPGSGKTVRKGSAVTAYMQSIGLDPAEVLDVAVDDIVISLGPYFREVMRVVNDKKLSAEERSMRQFEIYRKYRGQADVIADKITEVALAKNASICMETTGKELYWVRNATAEATERGYKTRVVFPYATLAQLINRTLERAQSKMSSGFGRGIHPMAISDICERSQINFFEMLEDKGVEEAAVIDNTVGMFAEKKALFTWNAKEKTAVTVFPEHSDSLHVVTPYVEDSIKLQSFSRHW